ncbi:DUF6894 family protein [Methylobacterium frigidaeris]|uniref:DUF6894 domain-containing protein n=1 Tax=Methylobacterium frigidaeris TaxID=2038277 RepID=A0AA37HED7_9HYPH|nr:hypothetical protein [Methylobacterium frigidaeris]PIK70559.1 hypothetical protein CS379_24010 [Methylobacterium frigidaeris]GJD64214.1 hypothetical protein MPEAHAMD_4391 [Methylobacterium frigidaeris]
MTRYRFHCTNGSECILDAEGTLLRGPAALARHARAVAEAAMRSLGAGAGDWAEWRVSVHDLTGRRVWVEPFVTQDLSRHEAALAA